jgi:protein subunit release factor B
VVREQEEKRQIEEGQEKEGEEEGERESQVVTTNFDPAQVTAPAREEVRKRVGQRVRELRNAVETLEERAMAD